MNEAIDLNVESSYNFLIENTNHTITYGEMELKCGMNHNPMNLQKLTDVLNLTMMYNKLRNEPFLAALVVNQKGIPGDGFYRTLDYLGVDFQNKDQYHKEEVRNVREYSWNKLTWEPIE